MSKLYYTLVFQLNYTLVFPKETWGQNSIRLSFQMKSNEKKSMTGRCIG